MLVSVSCRLPVSKHVFVCFANTRRSLTHAVYSHTRRAQQKRAEAEPPRASFIICRALTLSQRAHCLAAWSLLSVPWLDSAISV